MKEKLSKPQEGLGDDDCNEKTKIIKVRMADSTEFLASVTVDPKEPMENDKEVTKTLYYKVRMTEREWKKNGVIELLKEIGDMINEFFDDPYRFGSAEILTEGVQDNEEIKSLCGVERK